MKGKTFACMAACGLLCMTLGLCACSQGDTGSDNANEGGGEAPQMQTTTVDAAKVTKVKGDTATVTLGTWTGPDMSSASAPEGAGDANGGGDQGNADEGGTPPEAPSGDGQSSGDNSTTPPEKPEGDNGDSGDAPQGDAPQGGGNMGGEFTENGETTTIDLSSVEIATQGPGDGSSASANDITKGTILQIEKDDSGTITKVTILNAQPESQDDTQQAA